MVQLQIIFHCRQSDDISDNIILLVSATKPTEPLYYTYAL